MLEKTDLDFSTVLENKSDLDFFQLFWKVKTGLDFSIVLEGKDRRQI